MDYRKTAQEILDKVGGGKNIVSAAHCATRLRLVIADNSKADKAAIENVEGVKGVFEASGQLQIILGTGRSRCTEAECIYKSDQAAGRYFRTYHPGYRGERFPHGYHEFSGLHDK